MHSSSAAPPAPRGRPPNFCSLAGSPCSITALARTPCVHAAHLARRCPSASPTPTLLSAAWQRHLMPISLAARGGVEPSRAIPPYLFGKPLHALHVRRRGALRAAASSAEPAQHRYQREARTLLGGALGCARRRRRGPAVVLRAASGERHAVTRAPQRSRLTSVLFLVLVCRGRAAEPPSYN